MCNVQYVSSAERCRFSIAHCSLLIGGVRFRGSMREDLLGRILSMNHRCFPRRFRATADWRETKSAVALNLWGKPCVHGPMRVRILEVAPLHEPSRIKQRLVTGNLSLVTGGLQRSGASVSQSPVTSYQLPVTSLMALPHALAFRHR